MNWTKEQENAIYSKGSNILVAAAAGSGKTAVLVERIIQKIIKDKVNIDKLLVVTFTNAAASEMRERVLDAIYKRLDENPEDENLQKQIMLLAKSNICTIHSFCLDVIKNNFFEVDLSANFRIGNEEEIELLKQEVLEDLFEKLYEEEDKNFADLVDTYAGYKGDEPLKEIIFRIYNFIQSAPFPEKWLNEKVNIFKNIEENKDFLKTKWGKILIKNTQEELSFCINALKKAKEQSGKYIELEKYTLTLEDDIRILKHIYETTNKSWDESYEAINNIGFKTWPSDRKVVLDIKDEIKKIRDDVRKKVKELKEKTLLYTSKEAFEDLYSMNETLENLKNVILNFDYNFKEKKREKNIIDFNDIEHYALKILVKENENGEYVPTDVAKAYKEKFEEIAIDEYQDSNEVQEYILSIISKGNNIFMVGDVKQSIYKFRGACPELFLDKYEKYTLEGNEYGLKIQLFKNFRSRKSILDITNIVFGNLMSKQLGDIDYTKEEYLNLGAEYEDIENGLGDSEIHLIDLKEDYDDDINFESEDEDDIKDEILLEKEQIEAKFVASKINELIKNKIQIKDKRVGYRNIKYKDIVILLRSTSRLANIYEEVLEKNSIPVFCDASSEYLNTTEIQTIISLLKILDNPVDDISLVAVLRSKIGCFTDNEIVEVRLLNKNDSFYNCLIYAKENIQNEILKEKIINFLEDLDKWKEESDYLSLAELIWKIYIDTDFYNYVGLMSNGNIRKANLKILFERAKEYEKTSFKGLFNFIRFIERLKINNGDMSSAKVIGENEDVVRIMSIHKSKGLEFPVVFLCSTSKKINLQDLNHSVLLHQDIGIGPECIDRKRKIMYPSLAKEAIKIVSRNEAISEEMRVLYVALTRAKEKLIITGVSKNLQKDLEKKQENIEIYNLIKGKINTSLIKKHISYLEWIELIMLDSSLKDVLKLYTYKKSEIKEEEIKEDSYREFDFEKETDSDKINRILNWNYPKIVMTKLPIKSTVSKIKELDVSVTDINKIANKEVGIANIIPKFLEDNNKVSNSYRGTLMHLFLQKVDFKIENTICELEDLKETLITKKFITETESKEINIEKVYSFLNSDFAKRIKHAQKIEKEKAFCIKVNAKDFFEEATDETILVQGIIDLYFVERNGNIVLLDYKTDYVENEIELINKYKIQLKIYKKALEEGLNTKVSEVYIYSLYLNKEINVT